MVAAKLKGNASERGGKVMVRIGIDVAHNLLVEYSAELGALG